MLARHSKRVIAFEPNPACARHLARVAPRNCEVIAKAVSDKSGHHDAARSLGDGIAMDALATIEAANRFDTETRASEFATHEVPTVTLDQVLLPLVQGGERVAFVNIDVEGHEFAVLKGGEKLIACERPVLLVELEYRHGARVGEVFDWLKARRYVPRALADGKSLTPIDPKALRGLQDSARLSRRLAGRPPLGLRQQHLLSPRNLNDVPSSRTAVAKLVYIGGYGRSGSTLLEYLLTTSPEVVACGEVERHLRRFGRYKICTCGRRLKKCPVWGAFQHKSGKLAGWKSPPADLGAVGAYCRRLRGDGQFLQDRLGLDVYAVPSVARAR